MVSGEDGARFGRALRRAFVTRHFVDGGRASVVRGHDGFEMGRELAHRSAVQSMIATV